jgi:hypothetical protein
MKLNNTVILRQLLTTGLAAQVNFKVAFGQDEQFPSISSNLKSQYHRVAKYCSLQKLLKLYLHINVTYYCSKGRLISRLGASN